LFGVQRKKKRKKERKKERKKVLKQKQGASRLPYYCAPLVCVSDVIESLGVWRHYKPKTHFFSFQTTNQKQKTTKKGNPHPSGGAPLIAGRYVSC